MARVQSRPVSIVGLEVGATFFSDRLQAPDMTEVNERIYAVHAVLDRDAPEILAEYAHVSHDPVTGSGDIPGSDGWYVHVRYRLRGSHSALKPYARIEQVIVPVGEDIFAPLDLNYDGIVAGVRYDPGVFLALRLESRYERFEGLGDTSSLYAQASFVLADS